MAIINENYLKLKAGYLFPEIARRVKAYQEENSQANLIKLGIGDVVLPLPPAVVQAMQSAAEEMGSSQGFHGYGPERGYDFLAETIIKHDYQSRGVDLKPSEIFISDGSKCDSGNIQEIFSLSSKIAVADPVYPVYVDTNVMAGRTGEALDSGHYQGIVYLPAVEKNQFKPQPPDQKVDVVYLCSPNNPTGSVLTKEELKTWVEWAKEQEAILLYDAAYEAFIQDPTLPHSIYEIKGAKEVAIEFRSFSKTAGFTGTRCAFTVVPEEIFGKTSDGKKIALNPLWNRRQSTKFNGVSYVIQKAAAACYSEEGKAQIKANIDYYMQNAQLIRQGLKEMGLTVFGGEHAPYIWAKTPEGLGSWQFFDELLKKHQVVGTPGAGFGPSGEGYFRLSAFGIKEKVQEAVERIQGSA